MDKAIACYAEAGPGPGASKERGTHVNNKKKFVIFPLDHIRHT